jgi:N-acetylmuramoyl-L-alanine amidase
VTQIVFYLLFFVAALLSGCARAPVRVIPPPPAAQRPITPSPMGIYHAVQRGETLYRISKYYGVGVNDLMRANHILDVRSLETGRNLFIPLGPKTPHVARSLAGGMSLGQVEALAGPKHYSSLWRTITIHHSGTKQGSARLFDRDHTRRRMGGLFYHFVIGNGTYTPDGAIEVGWRWKEQVKANRPEDIQICLVGNFDNQALSDAQMDSTVKLVHVLRKQYGIPLSAIRKHSDIKGKHTDCPGTRFPFSNLLQRVSEAG